MLSTEVGPVLELTLPIRIYLGEEVSQKNAQSNQIDCQQMTDLRSILCFVVTVQ